MMNNTTIASRNPVAGNAWKYNKATVVPPKKGRGSKYKRVKKVSYYD